MCINKDIVYFMLKCSCLKLAFCSQLFKVTLCKTYELKSKY